MIWENSRMIMYFPTEDAAEEWPCVVKIDHDTILIEYDDEGLVQYQGEERGEGHYVLLCPELDGQATLHRFADSRLMEGNWVEEKHRGMWQIHLG